MSNDVKPKKKHYLFFRAKVILFLLVFVIFCLGTLWVIQLFFMEDLYKEIRTTRTEFTIDQIEDALSEADVENKIQPLAEDARVCVSIFLMDGNNATAYLEVHTQKVCLLHSAFSSDQLDQLYNGALAERTFHLEVRPEESDDVQPSELDEGTQTILLCSRVANIENTSFLILTSTEITPQASTITTMKWVLVYISFAILTGSALFAIFVPRSIAKSIERMSKEAKKMAAGVQDVHFKGGHTRETVELAEALNYAASEIGKVSKMQQELLANISHDLRTPLTMISGYSEVMRDIPGEITPENMQVIIDETARLTSLVNDTLDLSRLTSGEQHLELSRFSLTDTVEETIKRYTTLIAHQGYQILFEKDANITVYADQTKILQVIYNLINNAISYTGEDKRVIVRQTAAGNTVRISVIDSGPGIPEDQLSSIWERYFKLKEYHRRGVTGTGLGLSIVKNILKMHGANFGVISQLGHGSTFWFELPIVAPQEPKA